MLCGVRALRLPHCSTVALRACPAAQCAALSLPQLHTVSLLSLTPEMAPLIPSPPPLLFGWKSSPPRGRRFAILIPFDFVLLALALIICLSICCSSPVEAMDGGEHIACDCVALTAENRALRRALMQAQRSGAMRTEGEQKQNSITTMAVSQHSSSSMMRSSSSSISVAASKSRVASLMGAGVGAVPSLQRDALLALFDSTNGTGWTRSDSWQDPVGTECAWFGVTCDALSSTVVQLQLDSNHLVGSLPAELRWLTELTSLSLSSNALQGGLSVVASLSSLQMLRVDNNEFLTDLAALCSLTQLVTLDAHTNLLGNDLPSCIGQQLSSLQFLDLHQNKLSGSIPPSFGSLHALQQLSLSDNELSGVVPYHATDEHRVRE